ncbi:MAG TPA: DUF692 domain-containing protein [Burkholderiales bacterium]|nr:DUF692 domain-containing protein [Burkholderiales bacterium]
MTTRSPDAVEIPAGAGIGLRAAHYAELLRQRPRIGWLEVHSENYFGGGPLLDLLEQIRAQYPVSLHGVGLSLGSTDPLDCDHLGKLKALVEHIEPALVSEHLSWGSVGGRYFNDLLPLPYTEEALRHFCSRVIDVQDFLGRSILIENPSTYLQFVESSIPEPEFLSEVARVTDCGVLLDVNNVYVSAVNHGFDPVRYIEAITPGAVREFHLAGHSRKETSSGMILIDTHSAPVSDSVWDLYERALERFGPAPTLVEWDADLPPLAALMAEAHRAQAVMEMAHARAS